MENVENKTATMRPSYTVFETYGLASYLSKFANFNLTNLHLALVLGVTPSTFSEIFGNRKLESLGYCVALSA